MGATYTPAGPPGATGAAGANGAAGADGQDAPGWAVGYETAAADWTDTDTIGGATGVYKTDRTLGVRMRTDKAADGATDTDGNRVQGLVRSIAGGDFVVGMRLSFDRPGVTADTTSTAIKAAAVFVDGADVSTAAWYGVGNYYSGVTLLSPSVLRFANEAGADRFESYAAFATILNAPGVGVGPYDVFLVRSGTTLTFYMGLAGGVPQAIYSWTVTAGAGLIGLRVAHQADVAHDLMPVILAYRDDFAEVPW